MPRASKAKTVTEKEEEVKDQPMEVEAGAAKQGRGRKRPLEAESVEDDSSKKARIVVERPKLTEEAAGGCVLSLGQGDTGQLGLGEDIMERSKPALVKEIPSPVAAVVAGKS